MKSILRYRNIQNFGFQIENSMFELLLKKIQPKKILKLITAILLERKLILIKKDFGDLAIIMDSLLSLL